MDRDRPSSPVRPSRALLAVTGAVLLVLDLGLLASSYLPPLQGITLTLVTNHLEFPVAGVAEPGTRRLLIAERSGRVRVVADGMMLDEAVIDISDRVETTNWEQGLVGIALHPGFPEDGRMFLSYTERGSGDQVVASFRHGPDGYHFDPDSASEVLRVAQPGPTHQGGTLRFGPDGMLWIGFGDGGADEAGLGPDGGPPVRHGQDPFTLLGTMARVDVDGGTPYAIPRDNPFRDGRAGAPEVWAYGLRNPWSYWFDGTMLIVGDVGPKAWEEINLLDLDADGGANLGWSLWEGPGCYLDRDCAQVPALTPGVALAHSAGVCALTTGPVYRGSAMPELHGSLFYTDLCGAWLRTLELDHLSPDGVGMTWIEPLDFMTTAFLTDATGEVYVLAMYGGLYRIDPVR